jgi:hypothetical protein
MCPLELDLPDGVTPRIRLGAEYNTVTRVLNSGTVEVPWASGHIDFNAIGGDVGGDVHVVTNDAKNAMVVDVKGVQLTYSGPEVMADFELKNGGDKLVIGGDIYVRALPKVRNHGPLDEIGREIG